MGRSASRLCHVFRRCIVLYRASIRVRVWWPPLSLVLIESFEWLMIGAPRETEPPSRESTFATLPKATKGFKGRLNYEQIVDRSILRFFGSERCVVRH